MYIQATNNVIRSQTPCESYRVGTGRRLTCRLLQQLSLGNHYYRGSAFRHASVALPLTEVNLLLSAAPRTRPLAGIALTVTSPVLLLLVLRGISF